MCNNLIISADLYQPACCLVNLSCKLLSIKFFFWFGVFQTRLSPGILCIITQEPVVSISKKGAILAEGAGMGDNASPSRSSVLSEIIWSHEDSCSVKKKKKKALKPQPVNVPFQTHFSGRETKILSQVIACLQSPESEHPGQGSALYPRRMGSPQLQELGAKQPGWAGARAQAGPSMVFNGDTLPTPDLLSPSPRLLSFLLRVLPGSLGQSGQRQGQTRQEAQPLPKGNHLVSKEPEFKPRPAPL